MWDPAITRHPQEKNGQLVVACGNCKHATYVIDDRDKTTLWCGHEDRRLPSGRGRIVDPNWSCDCFECKVDCSECEVNCKGNKQQSS